MEETEKEFVERQEEYPSELQPEFQPISSEPDINQLVAMVISSMASIDIADNPERWESTMAKHRLGDFKLPKDLILSNLSPAEEYVIDQLLESARAILSNFRWRSFRRQAINMIIDATIRMNLTRSRGALQQRFLINATGNVPREGAENWGVEPPKRR